MSHFSPDLDDLRSEGWGGRPRQVVHWQFSACWLLVSLLIPVFIFDSRIGSFFTGLLTHLRLWLPFWFAVGAGCFWRDYRRYRNNRREDTACLVCDPQGLTLYDRAQRISHQWRWSELDSVTVQDGALHIIPRHGTDLRYRDVRLEHDRDTYHAIAAVAQTFLHGSRPPDAPTRHVTPHIWYEQRGKMRYDNRSYHDSFVLLLLLPLVAILPANIRDYVRMAEMNDTLPYLLSLAVCAVLFCIILRALIRHYRRRFADRANEQAAIDGDGLHFYTPFGNTISLRWAEMKGIAYRKIVPYKGPCHYRLDITDHLGNAREIDIDYLQDVEKTGQEIAAAADAVIHQRPLPPLSRQSDDGTAPGRVLFWINVLYIAVWLWLILGCHYLTKAGCSLKFSLLLNPILSLAGPVFWPFFFINLAFGSIRRWFDEHF